jgi:signal transduction histidine kinase
LVAALKWHTSTFQAQYAIACALQVSGRPVRLSPEAETAIYRIVQESLNNVAAHAQAHRVQIQAEFGLEGLQVSVEDDGVGFSDENALHSVSGQMGLIGMRERAQSIGGQLRIQSVPGQGTRVALTLPLRSGATREAGVG